MALLACHCLGAEKFSLPDFLLKTWDGEDGLPEASIQAIARTPDGYLWIATRAGLARFDGVRFVVLTTNNTPALGDDRISCLTLDAADDLWVGTEAGTVARRHAGVLMPVAASPNIRGKPVNSMAADATGAVWLAVQGAGLERLHNGGCDHFGVSNGLPAGQISQVVFTGSGQLFALADGKLAGFDGAGWITQVVPTASGSTIAALAKSSAGGLWVATAYPKPLQGGGGQVLHLKDGEWTELPPYPWLHATMTPNVTALLEDETGAVWVGTRDSGLCYCQPGQPWQRLIAEGAARQIIVNCLAQDDADSIWAGYGRSDQLQQIRRCPVRAIRLPASAEQSRVFTVCAARDKKVWIGTSDAGVYCWCDGQFAHYDKEQGLLDKRVAVILEDRQTNLWVGTWGGLFQLKGGRFIRAAGPGALRSWVQSLCEDREGRLWVGTSAGLVCLDAQGARVFGRSQGIAGYSFKAIEEDRDGVLWAAIGGIGLFHRVGDRFEHYGQGRWAGEETIRALHADAGGALWIATWGNGLFRLKAGRFDHWSTAEGLPSQMIHAIIEDSAGNLWFSSDNGFFGCPKKSFDAFVQGQSPSLLFWRLSTDEGLDSKMGSGAGQPVVARSADGRLWFPNQYALAVFDLAAVLPTQAASPVLFEGALVDGMPAALDPDGDLRVMSRVHRIELRYTSPTLEAPERVQFRLRLKGLESDWEEAGARRVAYYNHLPPGHYEFEVMAGGPDGRWHEAPHGLSLVVVPQWWERRWVEMLVGALFVGALIAGARMAERARFRRRLQELENQRVLEKERRRIAQDLHDDLGASVTEIVLLGELAMDTDHSTGSLPTQMVNIMQKIRQLVGTLDEVVWTINPKNDSLASLAEYLADYTERFLAPTAIGCRLEMADQLPNLPLPANIRHQLLLAVKEALNNVVRHAAARTVWLRISLVPGQFVIVITDDGRGFEVPSGAQGGDGLENMRQRMESIHGTMQLQSRPGGGTTLTFLIPSTAGS